MYYLYCYPIRIGILQDSLDSALKDFMIIDTTHYFLLKNNNKNNIQESVSKKIDCFKYNFALGITFPQILYFKMLFPSICFVSI